MHPSPQGLLIPDAEGNGWRVIDGADVAVLAITPILCDVGVELLEVVDSFVLVSQLLMSLCQLLLLLLRHLRVLALLLRL
jgi:hypothetical protein